VLASIRIIAWREWKTNYAKVLPVFFKLMTPAMSVLLFTMVFASSSNVITYKDHQYRYVEYLIPGLICVLTTAMVHLAHHSIIADKQSGIMPILITSGVSLRTYVIARSISNTFFEITRLSILFVAAIFLLKTQYFLGVQNIATLLFTLSLLSLFWYSLGILVAIFINNQSLKDLFFGFAMMIVPIASPAYFNITLAPQWIQGIAKYNPLTFSCREVRRALLDSNFTPVSTDFIILFSITFIAYALMLIFSEKLSTLLFER